MIQYCISCVMPSTRPHLFFDEKGVCAACNNYINRKEKNWIELQAELIEILERYRSKDTGNYDCIIPVSGGKDSTYQALKIKELGYNPLLVMATTCDFSNIGRRNIQNLKNEGFDCIEISINPKVRQKINRITLSEIGDISWAEHVTIFTIPIKVAAQMNIPLVIWGENSQNEYGGPAADADNNVLNRRWLEEFAGLNGLRVSDLIELDGITEQDIIQFTYPTDDALNTVGVTGLFLGHYIPWDGQQNYVISQGHGFESYPTVVEGHLVNYENLDNYQAGIHEYFMYLKYGFGRATSQGCMQIRRGRLSRDETMAIIRRQEGHFPWTYLGKPLKEILKTIDVTLEEFKMICDKFTNKKLFKVTNNGDIVHRSDYSPILNIK
jgi:N-acetyl sugar amidotransferase